MAFAFFEKLKQGLAKTRAGLAAGFRKIVAVTRRLDAATAAELEETLIAADIGAKLAGELAARAELAYRQREVRRPEELSEFVRRDAGPRRPDGDPGGGGERFREDHHLREAGQAPPGRRPAGAAGRRGHLPGRRHRPAPDLGPTH